MKRFLLLLCCFVCVFSLLCFSSCDSSTQETGVADGTDESISDSTENTGNSEGDEVIITLTSDLTQVSPGEEFTVTCTVKESRLFAAGDLIFSFDKKLMTAEFVEENVKSMYSFSNEIASGYQYSAYVASTADMEDAVLFTVYCTADNSCKSGDEIEITLSCDEWLIGTDEKGDDVKSIKSCVTTNSLLIKVK